MLRIRSYYHSRNISTSHPGELWRRYNHTTEHIWPDTSTVTPQRTAIPQNTPAPTPTQAGTGLQHIFYIMMENHGLNDILGNTAGAPYLNQLANTYGIALHYFGVTHPSLPNYLAAISGDFQGIWDDCSAGAGVTCGPEELGSLLTREEATSASNRPHMFSGQTLVDQLEAHNLSWRAYMQSMPSAGFTGGSTALYAQKHNPFVYFTGIRSNPARMQRIVPLTQFDQDIKSANLPNFVWITPDACSDMHGVSAGTAQALGIPACATYDGIIARGDNFKIAFANEILQRYEGLHQQYRILRMAHIISFVIESRLASHSVRETNLWSRIDPQELHLL